MRPFQSHPWLHFHVLTKLFLEARDFGQFHLWFIKSIFFIKNFNTILITFSIRFLLLIMVAFSWSVLLNFIKQKFFLEKCVQSVTPQESKMVGSKPLYDFGKGENLFGVFKNIKHFASRILDTVTKTKLSKNGLNVISNKKKLIIFYKIYHNLYGVGQRGRGVAFRTCSVTWTKQILPVDIEDEHEGNSRHKTH